MKKILILAKRFFYIVLAGLYFGLASQGLYNILGAYDLQNNITFVLQVMFLLVLHVFISVDKLTIKVFLNGNRKIKS